MGLKENFAQAVRELTGANKDDKGEKKPPASDGLRRALNAPDEDSGGKHSLISDNDPRGDSAARRERRYTDAPMLFTPERTGHDRQEDSDQNAQNAMVLKKVRRDQPEHMDIRPDAYAAHQSPVFNPSFVSVDSPIPRQTEQFPAGDLPSYQSYQRDDGFDLDSDNQTPAEMNTNPFDFPSARQDTPAMANPSPRNHTSQPDQNAQAGIPAQAGLAPNMNLNQQQPYRPSGQQGGFAGYNGNAGRGFGGGYNNAGGGFVGRYGGYGSEEELTVISRNTVIDGNIRSFANMGIDGDIRGDVETTKNIELSGRIVGNLTCNNAQMHVSQVQGNIRMKGQVEMERDTLLIGDLMSTYARVNGKIKGNIDVAGKMELKSDSVVFGDISASTITVEDGAIIQGYVSTTFLSKDESRNIFPESVVIDT
jgi:cytoskeletal protein CcmA (bactofilin family)